MVLLVLALLVLVPIWVQEREQMQVLQVQVLQVQVLPLQVRQVQLRACWTAPRCSPRRAPRAEALPRAVPLRAARRRAQRAGCGGGYSMTSYEPTSFRREYSAMRIPKPARSVTTELPP